MNLYIGEKNMIVDAKKIYVCKKTYNTVRSFFNSSEKDKYYWNTGVKLDPDRIDFTKNNKWRLCIYFSPVYKIIDQAWLYNYDYTAAVVLSFDNIVIVTDFDPHAKTFAINRDDPLLISYYILPSEAGKYESPINLMEVYVKMLRYIKKVGEALDMPFGKMEDNGVVYAEPID